MPYFRLHQPSQDFWHYLTNAGRSQTPGAWTPGAWRRCETNTKHGLEVMCLTQTHFGLSDLKDKKKRHLTYSRSECHPFPVNLYFLSNCRVNESSLHDNAFSRAEMLASLPSIIRGWKIAYVILEDGGIAVISNGKNDALLLQSHVLLGNNIAVLYYCHNSFLKPEWEKKKTCTDLHLLRFIVYRPCLSPVSPPFLQKLKYGL